MSWDAFIDPVASFLGQDAESQVGNLKKNLDGQYKPTFMDSFWGRADEGQQALDTQQNTTTRKKYKPLLESVGKTWTDGLSEGAAAEMYQTGKEEKSRALSAQINQDAFDSPQQKAEREKQDKRWALTQRQYTDSRTDVANQMELTRMQMATNEKNRLADRADAREARADELQLRRDQMQMQERKDERNRRRDSIAALTSGLAALGAAFAL